jgi:hypothetical protein
MFQKFSYILDITDILFVSNESYVLDEFLMFWVVW